jgi:type IV secretory pathway VirB2 component (pilin)
MLHKVRIAIAATLIAAAAMPFVAAPSNAQSAASQSYWDRHDTKGW